MKQKCAHLLRLELTTLMKVRMKGAGVCAVVFFTVGVSLSC